MQRRANTFFSNLGFVTDVANSSRSKYLDLLHGNTRITSSSDDNIIKLTVPFAKTVTFQSSFFIRVYMLLNQVLNCTIKMLC